MSQVSNSRKPLLIVALCLGLMILAMGVMSLAAAPAPVDISGTVNVTGNLYGALRYTGNPAPAGYSTEYVKGVPEIVCKPEEVATTFTGTVDVSTMDAGDVTLIGLLDKDLMASGVKGYQSGAYVWVYKQSAVSLRVGPSDGNFGGGELAQTYVTLPLPANNVVNLEMTIDGTADPLTCGGGANDDGCITIIANGNTRFDSYGVVGTTGVEFANGAYPGWDDYLNSHAVYNLEVNGCEAAPSMVELTSNDTLACGTDTATLSVDFRSIPNLYGYEFKVTYDDSIADAEGAFVTTWFNGASPGGVWDATCSGGICQFGSALLYPQEAVNGDGTVATIEFTANSPGTFTPQVTDILLSTLDGDVIPVDVVSDDVEFSACGQATVSGKIDLQGRATPMNPGWVKLIDTDGNFAETEVNFGADGNYTANVPVMPTGSAYKLQAFHYLYLANEKEAQTLMPDQTLTGQNTRLLGGDADNTGILGTPPGVNALDIGCIGGDFGLTPDVCGTDLVNSSTDINNDTFVNIQDLSIAGGNFMKNPFQNW